MTSIPWLLSAIALLSMLPEAQAFQCKKKLDPKRVIIMLDTNAGAEEVAAAERSACARGETLRVIPEISKTLAPLTAQQVVLQRRAKAQKCNENFSTPECVAIVEEVRKRQDEISRLKATAETNLRIPLAQEFERLQSSGAKLTSLIMSGHDGGGLIWGVSGSIDRYQFSDLQSKYSGVLGDVQSLYLLGCYTAVPKELKAWKEILPNMKLLAGYEGRAPLIDMKAGHYYLEDMLKREQPIIRASNEKRLDGELKNKVRGIANVNAAVFVNLGAPCKQCENTEPLDYYYRSQRKTGPKLVRMSERECQAARLELPPFRDDLMKFFSGEMPIPADTANGRLREIYEFYRRNEHCGDGFNVKADKILFLLFFEDLKKNFATYYAKDLQEAYRTLERMTDPVEFSKRQDALLQEKTEEFDWWKKLKDRSSTDPEGVKASLEQERQRLETEYAQRDDEYVKYDALPPAARANLGEAAWKRHMETARIRNKLAYVKYAVRNSLDTVYSMMENNLTEATSRRTSRLANLAKEGEKMARLKNIGGATRPEIRELLSIFYIRANDESTRPQELAMLDKIRNNITEKLENLSCLPFSWHEASDHPERPVCPN